MNKIFKVIWSKSKQCYVVVSEIAKNKTGKKKIVVAGIFAALAMVGTMQHAQAVDGPGRREGWPSGIAENGYAKYIGTAFDPKKGLVVGPNMGNNDTTRANGNVATVAIGAHSNATGSSSVAIGGAVVDGDGAIGLGWATATGDNAVALGGTGSTKANGNNAFAASGGNATGESATAIGSSAIADGRGGVAVGWNAESKVNAVGIGFNAKAKANNTIAIGVEANNDKANAISNNYSSVSIGVATRARAVGSMAMGVSADASGKYSIALGSGNVSGDYTATANYPKATGEKAIAIGYNSNSSNTGATAIGAGATASGTDSFAGGSGTAGGNSSIAIGKGASITTPTAGTTVGGQDSIAMGTGASANQHSSVTIGAGSTSDGVRNITIGPKASASGVDSIAIGNGGVGGDKNNTGVGGNGNTYTINVNDISTNVYYGVKSVDDGSIAFGNRANAAKGGLAIGTVSIADGGIAVGQSVLSKNGVAMGSAVSATVANAVAMGSTAEASSVGAVAIGGYSYSATDKTKAQGNNALAIGVSAVTNGNETIAIGKSANASNSNAVAVGKNANASKANAVALGSDSTTATNATKQSSTTINGITYNFAGATSDTGMQVSVGAPGKERQIKNVAAGEVSATSTDAINGSQLFAVASQIKPINYVSVKSSAVGNKNNDGATGTDAVAIGPGAQSSGDNGVSLGNGSQANAESVVSVGYQSNYGAQNNSKSIGIGWAAGYQSNGSENIGIGSDAGRKLTGNNNVSIGKSAGSGNVYTSGSVLLGQSATIINSTTATPINDVVAIGNGAKGGAASSIAIGKGANALGFSTIAIGENSNAKTTTGAAPSQAIGRNTSANGDYAVALGGGDNYGNFQGAKASGVGTTAIGAATVTKDDTNFQTAVGFGAKTNAINASAFGYNASAEAKNATALGDAASATAENATALGTGAVAKVKDSVAIGSGSKATTDKGVKGYDPNDGRTNKYGGLASNVLTSTHAAVSVGEGASVTRQITGVAAGTANTDAVNVAQLKSVNLAFSGNSGNNDVNLANGTLAIKGDTTYITTTANTSGITIAGKKQDISVNTNGVASANKGMADAQNVAQSINDAISKNAYTWTVSANGDAGESVAKSNKVDFNGDSSNITVERAGKKITTKLNKDITVDSVKANNKVTVGTAAKQLVLDGTTGAMTAGIGTNAIKLDGTSATITAGSGNNAISLNGTNAQAAFGSGTNAVSINGKSGAVTGQTFTAGNTTINTTGLTSSTGSRTVSFGTNGINAGNQQINHVASAGGVSTNAANYGDVKNAVSGVTLKINDGKPGSKDSTVNLSDQTLVVKGSTGIQTSVIGQTITVKLDNNTENATTKGIGIKGDNGFATLKYLKDGDAIFNVSGDGSLVTTKSTTTGVQVSVNSAKVKDLAVDAVTVSKATNIPDNPITVTPIAGTNSKDYAIGIDTTKLVAKTNLAYTANGATAKTVSLAKGLNFVNGTNTVSSVDSDGKVSFDLNQTTKDSISKSATAVGRTITLNADSGTGSSQSLSNGNVSFAVSGATGDYISTTMDGSAVKVSTKRATINSDANTGKASVTGADGLATAKNVADVINNAVTKSAYEWKLSANGEATTATVGKGDIVDFTGDTNITVDRNNKTISTSLNKNLTDMNSISLGNARGETIFLNGRDGSIKAGKAEFKDNVGAGSTITSDQLSFTNGATGANEVTTTIALDTVAIQSGPNSSALTSKYLTFNDEDGNIAEGSAKGIGFQNAAGKLVQFTVDEITAGGNKIKEVAEGTADTDAVNVKQLKDTIGGQSLTYRANTSADTDAKSVKLSKGLDFVNGTSTVASVDEDGKVSFDLNTATKTQINTNTADIATNKGNITKNTTAIAANTANIATNTANIAHTIALADDKGTSTTAKSLKDGNVSFNIKGDNKFISTAASGNDVTLTVNEQAIKDAAKAASSFKVKANAHAEEEVKGGDTITFNNGDNIEISQTGKTFTIGTAKNITVDSVTAGNTVINTSGLTNGTTAITGTGITTDKVTVGGISVDKTAGINAGGKVVSNVASGTVNNNATDDSNAANIGDVKQAVANLSQNLNITDGTNNGTVDLKNQKLNVAGANGVTATVKDQTITVGLDANTVNATTKGIGLTGDTGSTGNKYLKDGDVSFAVTGDGSLVSTTATTAGVKVAVDAAKVKDLAVAAVTVSKDAQADNPITVTPTAGTNSKDYAIGIDTTKLAAKTDLTYRANNAADANAKKVSLSKGLDFVDGGSTVATVDNDGKVSFDLNTATKTQINTNTANIATNTADIATNKGKIATNTTNIAANTTALARNISLGADTGTASSQSLSTADVVFNVKGATGDFVSTNMNGNTVEISTTRATINSNTTTGEASVTGADGLATAKNVSDAINKAAEAAKAGAAWNITTNSSTTDKTAVKGGDTVDLVNGDNIEITQDGTDKKKITVATKKDITVDSVTANNKVTVGSGANAITLNGADGSVSGKAFTGTTFTGTSFTAGNTVINTSGLTNGTTAITGTGVTTDNVTVGGLSIDKTAGINAGNKVISNVASGGTTLTNAANIGDVQNAVANLSQNLNITDGTNNGTVDLKNQKLNVAGANGVTATVNNQTITVGLDANTVNATTKGIGLTGDTGTTGNKYLKDGDVSFAVTGDGSLVSTTATAAGVKVAVNSASITAGADGTITGPTTDGVATAKNVADAINAAKKASKTEITANTGEAANATTGNVTLTSTTAADGHAIYDVKLNDKVTLGTGANAVTIDGTTGAITGKTATIGGVTVNGTANTIGGLSNTTWNGTAVSGRAATEDQLKAATGATTLKFTGDVATNTGSVNLKDDTFGIKGDGKYISTDVNGKNVNLTVSEAEVKKSAVAAVTVSTDTTDANNPLTVTPTTSADGTTKDYKVTIDGTKIANKTNLSYKANDGTAKQVSLADGLNFKNGTLTTASIDDNGVVKYDVNTASITAGADGTITGPITDGVATAQNVADAINAAKKASKTEITANTGEAANATTGNVTLTSTTAADGHTIYDVKLNDKVTLGSGANAVTVDGTAAKVTAGVTIVDGATGTITTGGTNSIKVDGATGTVTGLTNKDWTPGVTKAVTGRAATEDQLQKVADAASSQTWNITADKAGTTGAQTGTKKNATVGKDETVELVAGDNLTINQNERKFTYSLNKDLANLTSVSVGTGTTETIKLDGATGKITAKNAVIGGVTIDGDNNHVTGLANTTWNGTATTGRAATEDQLKAVAETAKTTTDAVNLKFSGNTNTSPGVVNLKDDTFGIVGDGKYVSTDANGKNLTVKVSEAEVKKSAVAAVTVSTDTTDANNPLTVTPTTSADGTTKDYKVTIDGTKIANKTKLSYKANDGTPKQVFLADGLNFKNGTLTTASIDDNGVVKYDVNTASITAGTDGTITGPTTDGVATAKNVADAINAAKKASKTEITANTGEAANATTGNVTLTSTTAADGHTIYDVKLNNKVTLGSGANAVTIDGTAGKATIGSSIVDGVNNTLTTGGAKAVTLNGATGTITGTTANLGGVTVDGTNNHVTGLANTTWNGTATTGRAATEDQLKAVADAAGSQTWEITADKKAGTSGAQTGTKENAKVGKDDKVSLIAGENLTVDQAGKNFTYSLNTDLVKMNSATFLGTGTNTTVITGDSITQTAGTQTNTSTAAGNTVADGTKSTETTAAGQVIKDGAKTNTSTVDENTIVDGTKSNKSTVDGNTITDGTNTTATTSSSVTVKDNTGNSTVITKDNITTGVGGNKIILDGTAGKATIGSSIVDGVNNTFTTGGANAVKLDGAAGTIKTGTVTVTGGTTNDITGLSNTTVTAADFATKGRAATEEQLKAVGEQTWQITADKDATTSGAQTGTKKDAKVGKDDKVQLIAGENMTVNQNERDFTFTLNKDLVKMNSATFEATGGKTTVIKGDSIVQTDGNKTNTATASGNTVADGTKSTETTAAGQVIKDGTKTNTSTVDENTIVDGTKSNKSTVDGNTITDGTNTTATTSTSVTVKDNAGNSTVITKDNVTTGVGGNKITLDGTAGKATIGSSIVDGVNNTFTTGGANAVKLDGAAGTIKTGTVTVTGGTTNDITGLSNTTVTSADFATKGRAATEEQLKAVGEQTWQITADKDATTSGAQTGTKKDAKVGKNDKVQLIAGENMTVNQNERDFTFTLNKDLVKMNSATFEATGGKTTVIKGDSIVQTDGTKVNTSTAGGNTVVDGTKSTATTADGTTVTSANGNTKYAADGVRINTTGKNPVSLTDAGLDNGNNVIKNVASGHVNNDATDNTNAANIADVKKATTTVTANAGEAANATKGNVTLTSTTAADGHTIYDVKLNDRVTFGTGANAVTIDGTAGKATIGSSVIDGVNNTFTTGGANTVKLDGAAGTIKTGTVTVTGGTTNDITGLSNTTVNSADFATKGRAATEEQLKAVGEQTWQITADKDAATSGAQTGTKKDAKVGKDDKVQLIAGENLTVNQNERDFTYSLNKDLVKMNSATFEATGGKTTVIKGDSIVQTDGTKVNTSTAGGNTVADGTKSTETTAAGQVIKDGAKSNKSTVDNNVIDDGTGNVNTSNATSNTITDGTNTTETTSSSVTVKDNAGNSTVIAKDNITTGVGANKVTLDGTAGKATIGSSIVDGVNNTFTTGGASPVTLNGATGTITGKTANIGGVTVDGTNNHVMGLANKDWTPGVTQAVSGRAATEDQLQKVSDAVGAGWKVNTGKVTGSTGESNGATSTKVASGEEVQFQAGNNLIVDQNGKTVAYSLNKALKDLESATFLGTGTNKTVITGDSITQTAGTQTNTSTAGGNTVADGTKSTETTADGQVIKDGAKSNKSTVDNNVIDDGNGNVNTSNATSNTITDGTNTTATTSSSVTVKDNAGNSTVITKDNITTGVGGNKITLDGTAGKATVGASVVDGVNNTFTTGGANAVKLDGVAGTIKTGTVTVTGDTTNDITGLSNTTVTSADFATKGRAATEEQLKAVGEQTWQITADKDATTSGAQTGTKKDAKVGKNDKVQLIAGENLTVNQNERDFTYSLNKDLVKMNSATFLGTGTNTTVITGNTITQTAGTQTNTSTASGNTVADGTKSTETTAAGQVIKDGAKSNKSTVDNNVIDDGNGNVNTSNATSNTITNGTNTSTVTAGKATIGFSIIDGVNNTFTTGGANAVKLDGAAGTIKTGTVTVTGGTTNDITGLSNTTVTAADFATKGRAATEEQLKAVGEQTWQITADKDATTSGAQTGTKKNAKVGKDDKVQLIAGENMTVNQNERDFTFTLNKDLVKMNSATFLGTGSNTTVITGNSITQTAGTQTNTSTAAGNTIVNGTKSTETTADGQVIKDGAKTNTSTVDENTLVDGAKSNKSTVDDNTITDGTNTTETTSSSVTVKDNAGNSTVIAKDNITTGVGANKVTLDGTAGKATIGSSVVDGVNNTFTTGGANAVKLDGVAGTIKTGTVTVTGGTTNDITGLSNTTVTAADFATKGRAATEEQLKAVGEQTWQITADKDATTSGTQTGTKKNAKVGKDDKVQLIAGENLTVNQNERDFTYSLNKDLVKMNSATFESTGGKTTVIKGDSIVQIDGNKTNTATASGNTVVNGTKSTETTADGQVIKDGTKSNKSTVDKNVIDDGNGNVNTSNATSNTITDGTNTTEVTASTVTVKDNASNSTVITKDTITTGIGANKVTVDGTAGKVTAGTAVIDGVNNSIITGGANTIKLDGAAGTVTGLTNKTWTPGVTKAVSGRAATEDQLQQVSDAVGAGWKVNTGTVAGSSGVSNGATSTKVSSGEEVKLQAGDNLVIDQNGKTVSYSLNKDLTKMNSATFEATGGKTTVIKGDSIVQTDGGKTNTSNAAGNTVVDGNKSTATTAAGTTITDGAKTNTSTADKNVINDGAGNTNVSNATSNTLKNAAGDETKADAKGVTIKDAAGNNATFTKDGITITKTGKDTVSLTSNGLDNGKNKIVNVAAGVANTDAVNVGQLKEYAAKSTTELTANNGETAGSTKGNIVLTKTIAADGHTIYDNKLNDKITLGTDPTKAVTVDGTTGTVTGLTNKTWTPGSIVSGRAATEDQLKEAVADSGWKAAVDKEGSGQSTVVGTSPEKIKAEETVTFKAGNNMMVTQTGKSISYAVNPELTDMKSATFKDAAGNTTVTNGNGMTITPGSANPTNPHAGPVSLTKDGLNNGNNQIKGVAPGTDPTDAVNVSQLNASNANTSQAINQIAGEVQHVGAHAAAMAALKPIQYDPLEPTQVMAGVGNYRGETAAALGLAHYTNENTMFNVGVSVGGNHNMVNAGVTHKFGYSPEKKNIPDRYKAGPISSVYVMQDEVSSLKKENAEQKYVIADQAARLTTLEAENEQQRRELAETKKGLDDLKAAVDKLLASKG